VLLHGLGGRIKVRRTRGDQDRLAAECRWGRKERATGYQLSGAESLLVISVCLLKSTLVQGQAHSQLPCQGGGQLPWFNACLRAFHPGIITPFLVKDGKIKAPKGNVLLFTAASANRVKKTAGVSCSQETKACFRGRSSALALFYLLFFFIMSKWQSL